MTKGSKRDGSIVLLLALLFGLGFGLNYGTSNQLDYLLESVRALHPTYWARDWFVTQTHGNHPVYAWLAVALLRSSPNGWAIAWANVVVIAVGMLALHAILRLLLPRERALPAFCLLLVVCSVTRTLAPGGTYAFSEIFQPSTLGSMGMLLASAAFVAGRPLLSGLALALAGVCHVNYLVLSIPVFGLGCLFEGRARLVTRVAANLGPPLIVLSFFLPFLLSSVGSTVSAQARHIYMDVDSPHHYDVPRFAWDFSVWAGFQLLGVAALIGPVRRGSVFHRRVLYLMAGIWALVVPAAVFSSVFLIRAVQQLFAWRVCAEADLLAQAALAAALVTVFCDGERAWVTIDRQARALAVFGLLCLAVGAATRGNWTGSLLVLTLFIVMLCISHGYLRKFSNSAHGLALGQVRAALLITLVAVNVARFSRLVRYSNLLSGEDQGLVELCRWAEHDTPENALFLTPPAEEEIRFWCHRAIVVDWKSAPSMPAEALQWYERMEDVTGRRPVRSKADLVGYDQLDAERVSHLRDRYGIDYVVVERGRGGPLGVTPVFEGHRFTVYPARQPSLASMNASTGKPAPKGLLP